MGRKENRGGILTNEQVERDNEVKGKAKSKNTGYIGIQDTGINKLPPKESLEKSIKKGNENS
jgi:hypothetical protein